MVFVLSIDKIQLGNAVCGVYGSESIDSQEYLKRFIDIEYSLPAPKPDAFYKYMYDYFDFENFLGNPERQKYHELRDDKTLFLDTCSALFNSGHTLRQQERIFAHARLALKSFSTNTYLIPSLFLFLIYLKHIRPDIYDKIDQRLFTLYELQKQYTELIKSKSKYESNRRLIWLEAYLLNAYNNSLDYREKITLVSWASNHASSPFKSAISIPEKDLDLTTALSSINQEGGTLNSVSTSHLTKKINITEPFKIL